MLLPSIQKKEIPYGARVLLRSSLNVPIEKDVVKNSLRIKESVRTIEFLREKGARITVIGHLSTDGSLAPVHKELNKYLPVSFLKEVCGEKAYTARDSLRPGEVLLLENLRTDLRELKNEPLFVEELGANTDFFVFDDFSAAHRRHASTVGLIGILETYVGINFYEEATAILRLSERILKPAVAIIGGAKSETKIPLIKKLSESYDVVFVCGVTANIMLKARGHNIGKSKVEDVELGDILEKKNIILPIDVIVSKDYTKSRNVSVEEVEDDDIIVDIGEKTLRAIAHHFETAKTVVVNGPTGWYEKGFSSNTITLSSFAKKSLANTFVGGGDTVSFLETHRLVNDWDFVSTGGGSLIDYLVNGTLPVIESIEKKIKE